MPTIEIISVDSKTLELKQEDFDLAIRMERVLESHRGLFYEFLMKQKGTIVHLGNPDMKNNDGGFFAGELLDSSFEAGEIFLPELKEDEGTDSRGANQCFCFKFQDKYKTEVDRILKLAIDNSPIHKIYFLTDFQFGPEKERQEIIYSVPNFGNDMTHKVWSTTNFMRCIHIKKQTANEYFLFLHAFALYVVD
jgi:hypothetical protein